MPRPLAADSREDGSPLEGTEFEKIAYLGASIAPLFPVTHTHASSQPVVNFRYRTIVMRYSEVIHPAAKILGKLL